MKLNLLNADRKKGKSIDKASAPRSRRGRNVLVFFAFVVLSAVFWFMQSLQDVYTTSFSIPISYSELPPDIGVSGRLPDRLDIMLKDQGIVLLTYKLKGFSPINISPSKAQLHKKKSMRLNKWDLVELLQKQLETSTTVATISPEDIKATFYTRKKKTVPVVINGQTVPKEGFYAFDPVFSPSEVTIYGSAEALASIGSVNTEEFSIDGLESDFSGDIAIAPIDDIVIDPTNIRMQVRVEQLTEQTFELPIITKNVPEGFLLRPLPGKVSIQLTLPTSHYKEVSEADLQTAVFYPSSPDSLRSDSSLPVELIMKPDWLKHYKITPSHVQFIIERIQ